MRYRDWFVAVAFLFLFLVAFTAPAHAQQIPPPSGPVLVCGAQAAPSATSYRVKFDGGAEEAVTMDATIDPACPAGSTHSFRLAASRFTVGQHTIEVIAVNTFGSRLGPSYAVTVGIAPGPFTINAVIATAGGGE